MLNRRKVVALINAGMGAAIVGGCKPASVIVWDGATLGVPSSIKLQGLPHPAADVLFVKAKTEIARLDGIFSLNRNDSEISKLNREGRLDAASPELIEVLIAARLVSELTKGAFDITVQTLWNTAEFLKQDHLTPEGRERLWGKAYDLVDFRYVRINGNSVLFTKPGVAITLNGLAQGYITDKISELLLDGGARSGLVNIGEHRAFGPKTWKLGLQNPHNIMEVRETISLKHAALATSSASGGYLSTELSHIFAPRTGYKKPQFISASVVHSSAMMADGLATAFTLLGADTIRDVSREANVENVVLIKTSGEIIRI